jgi:pimeloyl-ACP methyl ester carboxylesterase
MLLVHGVQDNCHTWDWFATEFADEFHVVALDLRGHGDSEWVRGSSYHHLDYVYDIAQLVRQTSLSPAVVVGHSMGGTLAALYAGLYSEAVKHLVLIEGIGMWPGPFEQSSAAQRIRSWIDTTRSLSGRIPKRYQSLEEAFERMHQANAHLSTDQARHLTSHGSNQNEDGTYSWKYDNYTHAFPAYHIPQADTVELWQSIACPTLCINAKDGFPHRIGQNDTLQYFRHGALIDIADAGHWTHHDQLQTVVAATRDFLGEALA